LLSIQCLAFSAQLLNNGRECLRTNTALNHPHTGRECFFVQLCVEELGDVVEDVQRLLCRGDAIRLPSARHTQTQKKCVAVRSPQIYGNADDERVEDKRVARARGEFEEETSAARLAQAQPLRCRPLHPIVHGYTYNCIHGTRIFCDHSPVSLRKNFVLLCGLPASVT